MNSIYETKLFGLLKNNFLSACFSFIHTQTNFFQCLWDLQVRLFELFFFFVSVEIFGGLVQVPCKERLTAGHSVRGKKR